MSKHTPGVWIVDLHTIGLDMGGDHTGYAEVVAYTRDNPRRRIARCGSYTAKSDPENLRNAQLIASAPELLEALKVCVEVMRDEHLDDFVTEAGFDDLIAKAEGVEP